MSVRSPFITGSEPIELPVAHGEGRFLVPADKGQPNIVISRKIASQHPDSDGRPKKVGDTLHIAGKPFQIVGMYETALAPDELITAVVFPVAERSAYEKFRNPASHFALVGVFVAKHADGVRVAVTGAAASGE